MEIHGLIEGQQKDLPRTLDEARMSVLKLRGIEHYVSDTDASIDEIDKGIEKMVDEVAQQLDAENMMRFITFALAWSDDEAVKYFSHPERQPFQAKIPFSLDFSERMSNFMQIGTYLRHKYEKLRAEKGLGDEEVGDGWGKVMVGA